VGTRKIFVFKVSAAPQVPNMGTPSAVISDAQSELSLRAAKQDVEELGGAERVVAATPNTTPTGRS